MHNVHCFHRLSSAVFRLPGPKYMLDRKASAMVTALVSTSVTLAYQGIRPAAKNGDDSVLAAWDLTCIFDGLPGFRTLTGSLSDDGGNSTDDTKQPLCTCVLHFRTFLCRHQQNNNVK